MGRGLVDRALAVPHIAAVNSVAFHALGIEVGAGDGLRVGRDGLQVLGKTLLMPRPYGPRVPLAAAPGVLRAVLPDSVKSRASVDIMVSKGLDRSSHWAKDGNDLKLAELFGDGFPRVPAIEVAKRIRTANPAHFLPDGRMRDGWRRLVIPERTVDLFQAYTTLVLEPLGVTVAWVDSWSYHVRFGGIHCGTNVLRAPTPPAVPWWRTKPAPK